MGRTRWHTPAQFREGIVIGSMNLYRIRSEADFAAMQMGIHGSHEVHYQDETWYRPGESPAAFDAVFHRPIQSFKEFVDSGAL